MGLQIRSLKIEPQFCTGCYMCMLICSFTKFKVFSIRLSLLKINYNHKIGYLENYIVCSQCGLCTSACPMGAVHIDSDGIVRIDYSRCIKCLSCVSACPINAFTIYNGTPYKCDLCNGNPQCVRFCLTGALHE